MRQQYPLRRQLLELSNNVAALCLRLVSDEKPQTQRQLLRVSIAPAPTAKLSQAARREHYLSQLRSQFPKRSLALRLQRKCAAGRGQWPRAQRLVLQQQQWRLRAPLAPRKSPPSTQMVRARITI